MRLARIAACFAALALLLTMHEAAGAPATGLYGAFGYAYDDVSAGGDRVARGRLPGANSLSRDFPFNARGLRI